MAVLDDDDAPRALSNLQVLQFLWRVWMRRPWVFWPAAGLMILAVAMDLAMPFAAGAIANAVAAGPTQASTAWAALWAFLGLSFGAFLTRNVASRFWNRFAAHNMNDLVTRSFADVQANSADWHANTFAGSTVRKITRGMWAYDTLSDILIWGLGPTFAVMIGVSIAVALQWPLLGLYVAVMIALFVASVVALSRFYIRPANRISQRLDSRIGAALADSLGNNPTVKAFGADGRESRRFAHVAGRWSKMAVITWDRFSNGWLAHNIILIALQAGLMVQLVHLWQTGQATPGAVTFAIAAFLMLSGYLRQFGEHIQMLQRAIDELEDVALFARMVPEVEDPKEAPSWRAARGEIVFDAVTFQYKGQDERLYDRLSLRIAPGETVALVGATGSGKSTFVKLVQRLYDVTDGAVRIDGADVRTVRQADLRQAIAVVPQEPGLFHRSIGANIAYARPGAGRAAVEAAARQARALDFIARLPRGLDTLVGERGVKLSGGERQRVALARAFLADAPILILDEATSSLDTETEALVQSAMKELMRGRTTILIAHRLSTVREADRILVFDRGKIVEQGTHTSLIASGGRYARLNAIAQGGEDLVALAGAPESQAADEPLRA